MTDTNNNNCEVTLAKMVWIRKQIVLILEERERTNVKPLIDQMNSQLDSLLKEEIELRPSWQSCQETNDLSSPFPLPRYTPIGSGGTK